MEPAPGKKLCGSCGSTTHQKRSSLQCPFNSRWDDDDANCSSGCPQQAPVAPKHLIGCAIQPPQASVSGRVDHGSACCRNYARTETSLACIRGQKTNNDDN